MDAGRLELLHYYLELAYLATARLFIVLLYMQCDFFNPFSLFEDICPHFPCMSIRDIILFLDQEVVLMALTSLWIRLCYRHRPLSWTPFRIICRLYAVSFEQDWLNEFILEEYVLLVTPVKGTRTEARGLSSRCCSEFSLAFFACILWLVAGNVPRADDRHEPRLECFLGTKRERVSCQLFGALLLGFFNFDVAAVHIFMFLPIPHREREIDQLVPL